MGSAQSLLSPEAALTAVVVAGAVGLGYTQLSQGTSSAPSSTVTRGDAGAKKGKKKKQGGKTAAVNAGDVSEPASSASKAESLVPEPRVVPFPEVIPGQFDSPTPAESSAHEAAASKAKKSKKKKGKSAGTDTAAAGGGTGANTPHAPPAGVSSSVDYLSEASVKPAPASKAKNTKRSAASSQQSLPQQPSANTPAQTPSPPSASTPSPQLSRPLHLSTTSLDTDGSWTRVGSRRHDAATSKSSSAAAEPTASDAGPATSHTGSSSPVAERAAGTTTTEDESQPESFLLHSSTRERAGENRRTLAEKLLPKPRKTGVDDMLETSDYPTVARVMRVQPLPNEKPASGFSWADYEDVRVATDGGENDADGEDDGWGVVTSKRPKRTISASQPASASASHPPHSAKASETLTKRQRQNADKRDAQKAAKADAEAERLATLALHKRELEKVKLAEQEKERERLKGKKAVSGGMKAGVDEKGRLVWE